MFAAVPPDVRKAYGFLSTVNIFREAMPPREAQPRYQ
jgi:hypothetical protein